MDSKTLITIVLTAIITVITKMVTSWLIKRLRRSELRATLSATARKWINRHSISILIDACALSFLMYMAFDLFFGNNKAASKQDVFNALSIAAGLLFFGITLFVDIFLFMLRRIVNDTTAKAKPP